MGFSPISPPLKVKMMQKLTPLGQEIEGYANKIHQDHRWIYFIQLIRRIQWDRIFIAQWRFQAQVRRKFRDCTRAANRVPRGSARGPVLLPTFIRDLLRDLLVPLCYLTMTSTYLISPDKIWGVEWAMVAITSKCEALYHRRYVYNVVTNARSVLAWVAITRDTAGNISCPDPHGCLNINDNSVHVICTAGW